MHRSSLRRLGLFCLAVLAISLPFELDKAWMRLGPVHVTNVEALLGLTVAFGLIASSANKRKEDSETLPPERSSGGSVSEGLDEFRVLPKASWLWLLGLFGAGALLSAWLAPEFEANALKAAGRTFQGMALVLSVPLLVRSLREWKWTAGALAAGGLLAALIGLGEVLSGEPFAWLRSLRVIPTTAGPFLRLTGSFDHANQAAMFIEATLPFLAAAAWQARQSGRKRLALLAGAGTALYLEAAFLTLSRSSFATIIAVALVVGVLTGASRFRRGSKSPEATQVATTSGSAALWLGLAGLALVLVPLNAALSLGFRLRLGSEGDKELYLARFEVPETLTLTAGGTEWVTVTVTNLGRLTWSSQGGKPVHLAGRWFRLPENDMLMPDQRWELWQEVSPGEELRLSVPLQAPLTSGPYRLEWDLVQEHVTWFSAKNGTVGVSQVTALQPPGPGPVGEAESGPQQTYLEVPLVIPPIPSRGVVWRLAWRQFLAHPLTGIGLDNFRLTYGHLLDWTIFNDTIHANNWYLETLVSLGLAGSLPFFAWLGLLLREIIRALRRVGTTARPGYAERAGEVVTTAGDEVWRQALGAGLLAYLIHGLLDYFLLFNATGLLFWTLAGLWVAQGNMRDTDFTDSHGVE